MAPAQEEIKREVQDRQESGDLIDERAFNWSDAPMLIAQGETEFAWWEAVVPAEVETVRISAFFQLASVDPECDREDLRLKGCGWSGEGVFDLK